MVRILRTVGVATLALMLVPRPTSAEPIRAVFAIDVVSISSGNFESEQPQQPFDAHFRLQVTFDSRVLNSDEFCCPESASARFGDPTFGDVPLEHFGIPVGIRPFDNHGTFGGWNRADNGTFSRAFSINVDLTFDPSVGTFNGNGFALGVSGEQNGLLTRPSLDPHDLLASVRPNEFPNFAFFTSRRVSDSESFFIQYLGHATFLSSGAAPIPEPSTVLLIGAGLAGAALRRRTRGTRV
jgi:hypothetical protein